MPSPSQAPIGVVVFSQPVSAPTAPTASTPPAPRCRSARRLRPRPSRGCAIDTADSTYVLTMESRRVVVKRALRRRALRSAPVRVVVIGAGFAGLAAADALARAGVETVVLEARDRVGGQGLVAGARERGRRRDGRRVRPSRERHAAGVRRSGSGSASGTRECATGAGSRAAAIPSTSDALHDGAEDDRRGGARGRAPVSRLRRCSTASTLDPAAREAIQARLEVSCAATADRVDGRGARRDRGPLGRPVPERGGRESAPRARARRACSGRPSTSRARSSACAGAMARRDRLGGRRRGRGRPGRARRARERGRPDSLRARRCRARSATPTPPSSSATRRSSSCRSPLPPRRAPCSRCPSAGGAGPRPAPTACSRSSALRRLGARARRTSGRGRPAGLARVARTTPPRPRARSGRRRPLHLGRRPWVEARVLGARPRAPPHGPRPARSTPAGSTRTTRTRADGRRARERPAGGAGDPRGAARLPPQNPDRTVKRPSRRSSVIVPELPAEIAELKRQVGRFIEDEVYPVEQRIVERNAIDPAELDALRAKARAAGLLDAQHAGRAGRPRPLDARPGRARGGVGQGDERARLRGRRPRPARAAGAPQPGAGGAVRDADRPRRVPRGVGADRAWRRLRPRGARRDGRPRRRRLGAERREMVRHERGRRGLLPRRGGRTRASSCSSSSSPGTPGLEIKRTPRFLHDPYIDHHPEIVLRDCRVPDGEPRAGGDRARASGSSSSGSSSRRAAAARPSGCSARRPRGRRSARRSAARSSRTRASPSRSPTR